MPSETLHRSRLGLSIDKSDWMKKYTITGYPKKEFTVREFDSAYDFEEFIKEKVSCKDIDFDSEFCQFFAYAKTEKRAKKFLEEIEEYFQKVTSMLK